MRSSSSLTKGTGFGPFDIAQGKKPPLQIHGPPAAADGPYKIACYCKCVPGPRSRGSSGLRPE